MDEYSSTKSSKRVFWEKDLNAFIDDTGNIEYKEVEQQLNNHFEQAFPAHYKKIKELAAERTYNKLEEMAESGELAESMYYLMGMAVIGESRTPYRKTVMDEAMLSIFKTLTENATEELKTNLEQQFRPLLDSVSDVPYKTPPVDLKKLKTSILKDMGEVIVAIVVAPEGDFFLLPDCTSLTERRQLVPDTIVDGQRFIVPFKNIAQIGMPLDSNIFIVMTAKKVSKEKEHTVKYPTSEQVFDINCSIFQRANKQVACENKEYLESFVEKLIIRE